MTKDEILALYEDTRQEVLRRRRRTPTAARASRRWRVMRLLAPYTPDKVMAEATRAPSHEARVKAFGSEDKLPGAAGAEAPGHPDQPRPCTTCSPSTRKRCCLARTWRQKGGVYMVTMWPTKAPATSACSTRCSMKPPSSAWAGFVTSGHVADPGSSTAYLHNAIDQLRGEACSLQIFSNDQFRNPMVVRIAGLGYQRGFGGHFHNDNSAATSRAWWWAARRAATMRR